ncbi:MAG: hypothetical protein R3309_14105, partial [Reinekea sp.]|nr:hypothetical protein [Reinekea sp.]
DQTKLGVRATWTDSYEKLWLQGDFIHLAESHGDIFRLKLDYRWTDQIKVGAQTVIYSTSDERSDLFLFRNNDVIQGYAQYAF